MTRSCSHSVPSRPFAAWLGGVALLLVSANACTDEEDPAPGTGGAAGDTGTAGSPAGTGAQGGSAGSVGGAPTGGAAGSGATGGTAGEGGQGASSGGSAGSAGHDGPILDWPAETTLACTATAPLAKLGVNPWLPGGLVVTGSGTYLTRAEGDPVNMVTDQLVTSSLDADGTLGASVPIAEAVDSSYLGLPDSSATADRIALAWPMTDSQNLGHLLYAELDGSGSIVLAPRELSGIGGPLDAPKVALGADARAVLYVESNPDYTARTIGLAVLDADGAELGAPKILYEGTDFAEAGSIVALASGFAAAYGRNSGETTTPYLAFFDTRGNLQGDPIALPSAGEYASVRPSLLVRGDELVMAWLQRSGGYMTADIADVVMLARFDLASRELVAGPFPLMAPVVDQENSAPELVSFGDDLGVVWSQGTIIYICAGCMPDNHLRWVVLDGDDFSPRSEVLVLENQEPMGGFIDPEVALVDGELLVTATLEYHVSGEGAFAAIHCDPLP